jgi:sugar/nucleoside kinase (ribokinase family)
MYWRGNSVLLADITVNTFLNHTFTCYNIVMKKLDFLAIGDTVIDAFIELEDASVHCDIDNENCTLSMKFADKIPYRDVTIVTAVGNSPNASASASRLGLVSGLATNLGGDRNGAECIQMLKENHIDTTLVQVQPRMKTNYHYVLMCEADRTILIKHEPYKYDFHAPAKPPSWIYLSSVGDNTLAYHEQIASYLEANPSVKLAFQPGTFQMRLGTDFINERRFSFAMSKNRREFWILKSLK